MSSSVSNDATMARVCEEMGDQPHQRIYWQKKFNWLRYRRTRFGNQVQGDDLVKSFAKIRRRSLKGVMSRTTTTLVG